MPCRYDGPEGPSAKEVECERVVPLLCAACKLLESLQIALPADVQDWWDEHLAADRRREKAEWAVQEVERQKVTARAKLTPADRAALGLR